MFMSYTIKILISNWPQFNRLLHAGRQSLLTFLTMSPGGHALRLLFMLWSVKIWQVSSCRKCMWHLDLFSDSWSWRSFVSPTCHVFNCLFRLDLQNEYSCYQDSSVIHGWFVYWISGEKCAACQNHRKSNFVWHCFRFSPCLMCKRV